SLSSRDPALSRLERKSRERSPCFRELNTMRRLPSGVRGPVDFWALARHAASLAGVRVGDLTKDIFPPQKEKGWFRFSDGARFQPLFFYTFIRTGARKSTPLMLARPMIL